LQRHPFALQGVIDDACTLMAALAEQKGLRFVVDNDLPAGLCSVGDAVRVRQILLNLAGNAVKFTEHGRVEIRVSQLREENEGQVRLRFDILDTGIGVVPDMRARLFQAFEQADVSLGRRHEGSGLGTSISRGLVEAMGGQIGYAENPPQGSCFWFELPFALPPVVAGEYTPAVVGEGGSGAPDNVIAFADPFLRHRARVRSMKVLVADDHQANRLVLQRLLQKAGHKVVCVNGGEAVLDAMAESDYDVAIVDLHMPGMSGLDMLKELRVLQAGGAPRTPVLVLSADVTPESIQQCTHGWRWACWTPACSTSWLRWAWATVSNRSSSASAWPTPRSAWAWPWKRASAATGRTFASRRMPSRAWPATWDWCGWLTVPAR